MSTAICDDELRRTVEVYSRHGQNKVKASAELGISRPSLQNRLARASFRGMIPPDGDTPAPGYIIKARSITTDADGKVTRQSVTHGREPGGPFALPEGHMVKGISALTDADGNIVSQWIKTTLDRQGEAIDAIREALAGEIPAARKRVELWRCCWKPFHTHTNRAWGPPGFALARFQSVSHHHGFADNWVASEGRMRGGSLPAARLINPDPATLSDFVAFCGECFKINNIGLIEVPSRNADLFWVPDD